MTDSPSARGHVKPKSTSLRPHNPFTDDDGLLQVGSRLINADISYEQKYPLILPPKDTVVRSMIRSTHLKLVHAGPKATLTVLRHKFWVNKGLQATKSVINACVNCQKRHKKPMEQKMAALPDYCVKIVSPFEKTA